MPQVEPTILFQHAITATSLEVGRVEQRDQRSARFASRMGRRVAPLVLNARNMLIQSLMEDKRAPLAIISNGSPKVLLSPIVGVARGNLEPISIREPHGEV